MKSSWNHLSSRWAPQTAWADLVTVGIRAAICIATRERPEGLRRLLESLSDLRVPDSTAVLVVVVENGSQILEAGDLDVAWPVDLLRSEEVGIPAARNMAVEHARAWGATHVAFLDDDETVSPSWLTVMLEVMAGSGADAVAAPVVPRYMTPPPSWIIVGGFFERERHETGTHITVAGTGNVLVRTSVFDVVEGFDPSLALTGGSDYVFFRQVTAAGLTMVWADDAVAEEWLPPSRVTAAWLLRRSYRWGNNQVVMLRLEGAPWWQNGYHLLRALAKVPGGLVRLLVLGGRGKHERVRSLRTTVSGFGTLVGYLGHRFEEYRLVQDN